MLLPDINKYVYIYKYIYIYMHVHCIIMSITSLLHVGVCSYSCDGGLLLCWRPHTAALDFSVSYSLSLARPCADSAKISYICIGRWHVLRNRHMIIFLKADLKVMQMYVGLGD